MTDEELKDIVADLMVDEWPDGTSINEMIWDRHEDAGQLSEAQFDELYDRVRDLVRTVDIRFVWPDDEPT